MAREPNIPLFLWVAAAIVTHLTWGGGADQVAEVFEERADVRRFAASVQHQVRQRFNVEVALYDEDSLPPVEPPHDEPKATDGKPDDEPSEPPKPEEAKKEKQKPTDEPEPEPDPAQKLTSKEPAKPKPKPEEQKKEAQKPKEEPKPEEEQKPIERPQPNVDTRRVAVVQHVEDEKQADNPEAEFLAEHNNKVREQQQARITATDQDNKEPTPGSQHMGPTEDPGDSHVTDIAQSDDSPGELNRAPSEDKLAAQTKENVSVSQPQGIPEVAGRVQGGPAKDDPGAKGQTAQSASSAEEAVPSVTNSGDGTWQIAAEREARLARAAREARRHRAARPSGSPDRPMDLLGLGATGRTEMGVNLNLSPGTALAAIGQDQLAREIQADGERRRSQHQGSWKAVGIERWRPAIENYVASVKLGNQTALNTAAVPFATYLNHIHNRLHPIFAGSYLSFLDGLPGSAGLRDNDMATNLEIVLSQANGSIVKMGVTRTSGVTAFDISALDAVQRASPFGAPPPSIVSPDGNVYLHWEFHRNPLLACSTYFARPYIIKTPQKSAPPSNEPPGGPFGPEEGGSPPAKQGHNSGPGAGREKTARLTNYAAP